MWIQLAKYKSSGVHCASCYVIVSTSCHDYNFTYLSLLPELTILLANPIE